MIKKVETKADLTQFVQFPHTLYRDDPMYVPQLNMQQKALLGKSNPFFEHSETAYFLALEDGKVLGRIAAILNRNHLKKYNDQTGFFGFFDCYNRPEIARQLLDAAINWLREQGIKTVVGPENLTTNDSCGLLVDGFEEAPAVMMPYNKPYYEKLLQDYGFQQLMELYQYRNLISEWAAPVHEKFVRIEARLKQSGITIRNIDLRHLQREIPHLRYLYNTANEGGWGFVPLTEAEFNFMAADLKQIVESDSLLLAEKNGQPIGYMIAVPDLNEVFKKIKNGELLWTGWIHLLNWKKNIRKIRLMIMGILPEYRNRGIDGAFYVHLFHYMKKRNIQYAEACYVMEDNTAMIQLLEHLKAEKTKTFRLYKRYI